MKTIVRVRDSRHNAATHTMLAVLLGSILALIVVAGGAPAVAANAGPPSFTIKSLGFLPHGSSSYATSISYQGEITGYAQTYRPHYPRYRTPNEAFLYNHGRLMALGLPPGSQESFGVSINNSGLVAVRVERAD